jgi:hypothetical protein
MLKFMLMLVAIIILSKFKACNHGQTSYKEYTQRQLQMTTVSMSNICSKSAGYQTSVLANTFQIKRSTDNLYFNDGFIMTDNILFSTNPVPTALPSNTWNIRLINIGLANLFIGLCVYNSQTCKQADYYNQIVFSGLGITYQSTDCYHIDHHYNNAYWYTARHCLSQYELLSQVFSFTVDLQNSKYARLSVAYEGYTYYSWDQIWLQGNESSGDVLDMASPCVLLYVKDSVVEMEFP